MDEWCMCSVSEVVSAGEVVCLEEDLRKWKSKMGFVGENSFATVIRGKRARQ